MAANGCYSPGAIRGLVVGRLVMMLQRADFVSDAPEVHRTVLGEHLKALRAR